MKADKKRKYIRLPDGDDMSTLCDTSNNQPKSNKFCQPYSLCYHKMYNCNPHGTHLAIQETQVHLSTDL